MRRHWAVAALLACVAPLLVAFAWQAGLASLGDDSASYLVLAQALAGSNPAVAPWVGYHTHFPPLFPLLLVLTGGAWDTRLAHAAVALLAAAAMLLAYRFALRETGRRDAAFVLVAAFALCPTAWISAKGILSEPMYLCASLACLIYFQARLEEGRGTPRHWLAFGLLLAATVLTRVVGATLVAALVLHLLVQAIRTRKLPHWRDLALAFVPSLLLVGIWLALKPIALQDSYQRVSSGMANSWLTATALMAEVSVKSIFDGWLATFNADAQVGMAARIVAAVAGLLGLAGMALRLARNRLDAWYVAISLAVVFGWVFSEDNTRRLLYPLLPLLLLYAGEAVAWLLGRAGLAVHAPRGVGVAALILALVVAPAMVLVASKALDREPVLPGHGPRYSDITEYYTTINVDRSRAIAARHATVLAGLEALQKATPPGARVMWMRPEYVALLGRRDGAAWYYRWDEKRLAREVRDARVDYLIVARLFKTDLTGRSGDPFATLNPVSSYSRPVMSLTNPATGGTEFVLLRVDRRALDAAAGG